jgi:hypothetical protein
VHTPSYHIFNITYHVLFISILESLYPVYTHTLAVPHFKSYPPVLSDPEQSRKKTALRFRRLTNSKTLSTGRRRPDRWALRARCLFYTL